MAGKESGAKEKEKKYVETPLMKQYYSIKAVHGDAVLLFRVGDFYETFGEDAVRASRILGITLTRRANGVASYVELAGFPYHALDTYLPKLVRAGERVAVCEQLEDPKQVKGIVKRGVIELVTPGVVMSDNVLVNKENTFLASVYFGKKTTGVAFLDLSTGEFYVAEGRDDYVDKLLSNLAPKEIVYQRGWEERFARAFGTRNYHDGNNYRYFTLTPSTGSIGLLEVAARKPGAVATVIAATEMKMLKLDSAIAYEYLMTHMEMLWNCIYIVANDLYQRSGNDGFLYYKKGLFPTEEPFSDKTFRNQLLFHNKCR